MSDYWFQKRRAESSRVFSMLDYNPNWWIDTSDPAGITPNGSKIAEYLDLSGNGAKMIQTNASRQHDLIPNARNGLAVARTLTNDSFYQCVKDFITSISDTYFFVFKPNQAGFAQSTLLGQYGDVGAKSLVFRSDSDGIGIFTRSTTGELQIFPAFVDSYSLLVITRNSSGGNGTLTVDYNGVSGSDAGVYSDTTYDNKPGGGFPTLGAQPMSTGTGVLASIFYEGDFCEGVRMPGVLNTPDIDIIKSHLKAKWATV